MDEPGAVETIQTAESLFENEAQAKAQSLEAELVRTREILNADQLASLVAPRARHEQSFEKLQAHFYSIDGVLNGRKISGALFAGHCMLVYALTQAQADDVANRGLRSTVELLHREYETRALRGEDLGPMAQGTDKDVGGRRAQPSKPGEELATLPKLKAIIAHEIGGLPWKW